jgi:hypothetical protein
LKEKEKSGFGGTTRPGVEPGPAGYVQLGSWRAGADHRYESVLCPGLRQILLAIISRCVEACVELSRV